MEFGGSSAINDRLKALEGECAKIARVLVDLELETKIFSSSEEEFADALYTDMDLLYLNDTDKREKVIRKYISQIIIEFDPNDPPRSGYKRNYSLDIEAVISKNSCSDGTPKGNRTPVFAVRGRRLDRLTMEAWLPN